MFTITCPYHGQYVIYYNERLHDIHYPKDYSAFAYNDLCEFEVYGTYGHLVVVSSETSFLIEICSSYFVLVIIFPWKILCSRKHFSHYYYGSQTADIWAQEMAWFHRVPQDLRTKLWGLLQAFPWRLAFCFKTFLGDSCNADFLCWHPRWTCH